MYILAVCDNSSLLNAILFVKNIINIIFVVVPIILALLFTIDLAKNVFSKDDNDNQKNLRLGIKRIIYSLILLLVPTIIEVFMNMIDDYSKVADCYTIATEEKVKELHEKEEEKYQEMRDEKDKEHALTAEEVAAEQALAQKEAKAAAKRAVKEMEKQNSQIASNNSSSLDLSGVSTNAEKIALTAEKLAWPLGTSSKVWFHHYQYNRKWKSWSELTSAKPTKAFMDAYDQVKPGHFNIGVSKKYGTKHTRIGASCDKFAGTVVRYSGYDKTFPDALGKAQNNRLSNTKKWSKVSASNAKRGAVCIKKNGHHILIYLGNGKVAHAGYGGLKQNNGKFGRIEKFGNLSAYNCWNAVG